MTLQPTPSRTVAPMPGSYMTGGCDCNGNTLRWPGKQPSATDDYWLDATLEVADSGASVTQFAYSVYYGDGLLTVKQQIVDGNKCGLLLSGGTFAKWYAVRLFAVLDDNRILSWNVALPINDELGVVPEMNMVTLNGIVLVYAGRSFPVNGA